jgi:outer membrane protein OmpA-like peptidoglycan-associated protein
MKKYFSLLLCSFFVLSLTAQKKDKDKNEDTFQKLPQTLLVEINKFRKSKGLDTLEFNEMLTNAAMLSASNFDDGGQAKVDAAKTKKNLKKVGATSKGEECLMSAPVSKGRENYSVDDVAKVIYTRWENNKKDFPILLNPKYVFVGISYIMSSDGKKVYASAVFGGYDINNDGAKMVKELKVPFNTKSKKMKAPDLKGCKNCEKFKNYDNLQKGIYVSNGKVYLKYNNMKELKKFLKKPKDGLAIDIVQRDQYGKDNYNIVDNNLYNKGIMSKVIYKDKFFKKNLIKPDPKAKKKVRNNKIEVEMAKFDPKITGPYEVNLIVVQDGKVCKTVTRSYLENGDQESSTPIGILPAPESKGLKPPYEPRSESSIINFTIPFAKNKFEFKNEDIQPLINALNEPDFIIEGLYIYAYSSIEGDSIANAKLQRKRAESVAKVLQGRQSLKIQPNIETRDSWDLFMLENDDGPNAALTTMGKKAAIKKINDDKKLQEELEPVLAKERFAQVIMDITYDVSGNKEQRFTNVSFGRALKAGKEKQAYKIMEYISKATVSKKYSSGALDSLEIPEGAQYVNLANNKVHYRFLLNGNNVDDDDQEEIERLYKLAPDNEILKYNRLYCAIRLDTAAANPDAQAKMQSEIDEMYTKTKIEKRLLDGLNIEWQFKIMEALDTADTPAAEAAIDACVTRIKGFYDIKESTWQNALKLAFVFTRAKDYKYACSLLEPFVTDNAQENLIFAYISIACHLPDKFYARNFARALSIAHKRNNDRYCKLFGEPFMSFQVLDNPVIKKEYFESGCKK